MEEKVKVEVKQEAVPVGLAIGPDNETDGLMNDGCDGYDDHHIEEMEPSPENIRKGKCTVIFF